MPRGSGSQSTLFERRVKNNNPLIYIYSWDLCLLHCDPDDKIRAIKAVKRATNFTLRMSKDAIDSAPCYLGYDLTLSEAKELKGQLEGVAGISISLSKNKHTPLKKESRWILNLSSVKSVLRDPQVSKMIISFLKTKDIDIKLEDFKNACSEGINLLLVEGRNWQELNSIRAELLEKLEDENVVFTSSIHSKPKPFRKLVDPS